MNKIEIPTYVYMSVDYTDGLKGQAARDSYKGVNLRVEYGASRTDHRSYFTGDFAADYNAAVAFVQGFGQAEQSFPFMGSSSVDSFMFDAGYDEEATEAYLAENEADIPFASDADLATDQVAEVAARLAQAWDKIPAEKLQYALAKVIASSDHNTSYPGAPLGRAEAMDALAALDRLLAGAQS